jgi:hypothetical protein
VRGTNDLSIDSHIIGVMNQLIVRAILLDDAIQVLVLEYRD